MGKRHRKPDLRLRTRVTKPDLHRPRYHFLPPANWMNDPNGLIQWRGRYHMFYQYNPNGAFHGCIHWGHAVSDDLVHWEDLPIALTPTPGGPDKDGCWSGCAVDNGGVPTVLYTGVFPQTVCIATSSDDMLTWEKHEANPVIEAPPYDVRHATGGHFRDPYVWREDGSWYLLIGSKIRDVGGMILLYRSDDLIDWEYMRPLMMGDIHKGEPFWAGTMWECPNLLRFGDHRALVISLQATPVNHLYAAYHTGIGSATRFESRVQGILVHGGTFYAPQVMQLDDGRYVLWGWLKEARAQRISEWSGWAGVMSLPLAVSLLPDGKLGVQPVEELQALRQGHWHCGDLKVEREPAELLSDVEGDSLEIMAEFSFEGEAEFGLRLRCSPDGQEQTRVVYRSAENQLVIERNASSVSPDVERNDQAAPLEVVPGEPLKLHVFVDHSVIEVFADRGRTCLVSRVYPLRPDSLGVGLFAREGPVTLKSLDVWALDSIWT
jgi:beta-fructofuranosidase